METKKEKKKREKEAEDKALKDLEEAKKK